MSRLEYHTGIERESQFTDDDVRALITEYIQRDAESGFATYLFDVLPRVNQIFDTVAGNSPGYLPRIDKPKLVPDAEIEGLIDWVVSLCSPVCIYLLPTTVLAGNYDIDLLIVTPKHSPKTFKEYSAAINSVVVRGRGIRYSLCQMQQLTKYIEEGSIFHISACRQEQIVYYNEAEDLPVIDYLDFALIEKRAAAFWEKAVSRSHAFLSGARDFANQERREMAAFMLQQTTEMILRGLIFSLSGIEVRNHSVSLLLLYCKRYAPGMNTIFPGGSALEDGLITLLESAYIGARYNDDFRVTESDLHILLERIILLIDCAQKTFDKTINNFSRLVN